MKEKIIEILAHHTDGLRLREIAMYLDCHHFALISEMNELKKAGLVGGRYNKDHANGEYYIIWFLVK